MFTCVLGAQYDHLIETVLLSTNSIFLLRNKTNNYGLNIIKASGLVVLSVYVGMAVRRQLYVTSSTCHRSLFCDQSCSNQPDQPLILKFCTTEISKERLSIARIALAVWYALLFACNKIRFSRDRSNKFTTLILTE